VEIQYLQIPLRHCCKQTLPPPSPTPTPPPEPYHTHSRPPSVRPACSPHYRHPLTPYSPPPPPPPPERAVGRPALLRVGWRRGLSFPFQVWVDAAAKTSMGGSPTWSNAAAAGARGPLDSVRRRPDPTGCAVCGSSTGVLRALAGWRSGAMAVGG
jgi:hypothetical protein